MHQQIDVRAYLDEQAIAAWESGKWAGKVRAYNLSLFGQAQDHLLSVAEVDEFVAKGGRMEIADYATAEVVEAFEAGRWRDQITVAAFLRELARRERMGAEKATVEDIDTFIRDRADYQAKRSEIEAWRDDACEPQECGYADRRHGAEKSQPSMRNVAFRDDDGNVVVKRDRFTSNVVIVGQFMVDHRELKAIYVCRECRPFAEKTAMRAGHQIRWYSFEGAAAKIAYLKSRAEKNEAARDQVSNASGRRRGGYNRNDWRASRSGQPMRRDPRGRDSRGRRDRSDRDEE